MRKEDQDQVDRFVKKFDHWAIEIIVNATISLLTTTFILYCAGII